MDTQKELIAQKIELEYNQHRANPKMAWWNLVGLAWVGGLGYYLTAKGNKDMITKGVMWTLAAFFTNAIVTTFGWLYLSVDFMGIAIYAWMVFDSYFLMKKVEENNVNLKKEITERVNSEINGDITKEELRDTIDNEATFNTQEVNETSKSAVTKNRPMSDTEFNELVIKLSEQRIKDGYDPLSKEQVNRMKEIYQPGDKD